MFFIDFGDVENVTFDNISVLPKKIASLALPSQAIQCCLSGFTNRTCSPEDCEYLTGRFVVCVYIISLIAIIKKQQIKAADIESVCAT